MWQVTAKELRERYRAIRQFDVSTGTQKAVPEDPWGPETELWRRYRNGRESIERLPLWLAQHTLAAIPIYEPEVERAKLIRNYDIDSKKTITQPNRGKNLNIEDCITRIKDEIGIINDELGEIVKHQGTMRTDIDWIKDTVLPRIEKEVWAIIILIVGIGLAVWFLK